MELEELRVNQLDEESTILNAQAELETKRSQLSILINASAPQVDEVDTHTPTPSWPFSAELDDWLTAAKDHSPELLIAIQKVAISQIAKQQSQVGIIRVCAPLQAIKTAINETVNSMPVSRSPSRLI